MKHLFIVTGIVAGIISTSCGESKKALEAKAEEEVKQNEVVKVDIEPVNVIKDKPTTPTTPTAPIEEVEVVITKKVETPEMSEKPKMVETPTAQTSAPVTPNISEPKVIEEVVKDKMTTAGTPSHDTFNTLLATHVSPQGNVNYNGFKSNWSTLRSYIKDLSAKMPTDTWSKEDKLSYWMNAYNAMTIDLILRNQPIASIKDIKDPWDQRLWQLGKKWYNLNEIEHQILRKMGDARIHFGINCASFSCPPILNEAFTADKVDAQLEALAKGFINDKQRNTITENSIEISKIFSWFAKDFKTNGTLIDFLNKYSDTPIASNAKKRFKDYDWTLNK